MIRHKTMSPKFIKGIAILSTLLKSNVFYTNESLVNRLTSRFSNDDILLPIKQFAEEKHVNLLLHSRGFLLIFGVFVGRKLPKY